MNPPEQRGPDAEESRLEARAADQARIYQAGRDQYVTERDLHLHYEDGVRRARRAEPAGAADDECPCPGLAAFGQDQARWFFGRAR
ncbi:hypothetical protein ACFQ2B_36490 [Streptomyces stramineus]|uniref:Uncharacterized protein n=1 Tax=Streptomyces stramineus TaxID=173861 RepID=A0ABN0ZD45_9ACTN